MSAREPAQGRRLLRLFFYPAVESLWPVWRERRGEEKMVSPSPCGSPG